MFSNIGFYLVPVTFVITYFLARSTYRQKTSQGLDLPDAVLQSFHELIALNGITDGASQQTAADLPLNHIILSTGFHFFNCKLLIIKSRQNNNRCSLTSFMKPVKGLGAAAVRQSEIKQYNVELRAAKELDSGAQPVHTLQPELNH